VLAGLPASTLAPFQRVLHAAARTVQDLTSHFRVTPALQRVTLVTSRKEDPIYKLCLLVHKSLLENMPEYMSDLLTPVADIPA